MVDESSIQRAWIRQPRSVWRLVVGWLCIGLGLLGIILPIIPGIPLLVAGLVFLSTQYHWAHRGVVWMKARFHKRRASHESSANSD